MRPKMARLINCVKCESGSMSRKMSTEIKKRDNLTRNTFTGVVGKEARLSHWKQWVRELMGSEAI